MKYFFEDKKNQDKLEKILDEWVGTPWRHWSGVKFLGTDCIHFVLRVLEELNFGPFKIEEYPQDFNLHAPTGKSFLERAKEQINFEEVNLNNHMNGDIILYWFGKMPSHAGFYFDEHVFQAVTGVGVIRSHWLDKMWNKRKRHALRILA